MIIDTKKVKGSVVNFVKNTAKGFKNAGKAFIEPHQKSSDEKIAIYQAKIKNLRKEIK